MDEINFLKRQLPACTYFPFYDKLGRKPAIYAKLSARSLEDFNENLLGKYCPKRYFCSTSCIGRPIPKYPELEELCPEIKDLPVGEFKGKEVYLYYATLCQSCPIKDTCGKPCGTLTSFLEKDEPDDDITSLEYNQCTLSDDIDYDEISLKKSDFVTPVSQGRDDIEWGVLNEREEFIVRQRTLWLLEWEEISEEIDEKPSVCQRTFKKAMKKLQIANLLDNHLKKEDEVVSEQGVSLMMVKQVQIDLFTKCKEINYYILTSKEIEVLDLRIEGNTWGDISKLTGNSERDDREAFSRAVKKLKIFDLLQNKGLTKEQICDMMDVSSNLVTPIELSIKNRSDNG